MNTLLVITAGIAGAGAGIPIAAVSYGVPPEGPLRVVEGWWRGLPARPTAVFGVTAATGALAASIVALLPASLALPAFWLTGVVGVGLAIIDVRCHRLPYVLTGSLWLGDVLCFSAAASHAGHTNHLVSALAAGPAITVPMLIIALALPGQLGLGDVALMGVIATNLGWLGYQAVLLGIFSALALQGASAGLTSKRGQAVPMGPTLVAGWLAAVVTHFL